MSDELRGMEISGRWVPRDGIERDYRCRRCHARVGRPYADPVSGELNFERMVCAGPDEHEIRGTADVVHERVLERIEERELLDADEVLVTYYWLNRPAGTSSPALFGDKDFEGFD